MTTETAIKPIQIIFYADGRRNPDINIDHIALLKPNATGGDGCSIVTAGFQVCPFPYPIDDDHTFTDGVKACLLACTPKMLESGLSDPYLSQVISPAKVAWARAALQM